MTIREAISDIASALQTARINEPDVEAKWIISHVLDIPLGRLLLNTRDKFPNTLHERVRSILERRRIHEPLQHILGSVSFCGIEIEVTPDALIPRPETELLAEAAWIWLNDRSPNARRVLDIGTGTGCIPIAITRNCPTAEVHAVDISNPALSLARRNAARNDCTKIQFFESDLFAGLTDQHFDLIVSNPPYIPTAEIETLDIEVRNYDPTLALDGGDDGLDFYRRIANEVPRYLCADGILMCEFGDGQSHALAKMFTSGSGKVGIEQDLTGRDRFFRATFNRDVDD
tara:strand:- start:692 stop:1552 length:861 start_codon:yes stop_codon:yes gene_type:complete